MYRYVAVVILGAAIAAVGAWRVQEWRYAGQIQTLKAQAAEAANAAQVAARAREQKLNAENERASNAYLAEKSRAAGAVARAADAKRMLDTALAAASAAGPDTAPPGGADDPRPAIASECAGALLEMDRYARTVAATATGLQDYAGGVCMTKD